MEIGGYEGEMGGDLGEMVGMTVKWGEIGGLNWGWRVKTGFY